MNQQAAVVIQQLIIHESASSCCNAWVSKQLFYHCQKNGNTTADNIRVLLLLLSPNTYYIYNQVPQRKLLLLVMVWTFHDKLPCQTTLPPVNLNSFLVQGNGFSPADITLFACPVVLALIKMVLLEKCGFYKFFSCLSTRWQYFLMRASQCVQCKCWGLKCVEICCKYSFLNYWCVLVRMHLSKWILGGGHPQDYDRAIWPSRWLWHQQFFLTFWFHSDITYVRNVDLWGGGILTVKAHGTVGILKDKLLLHHNSLGQPVDGGGGGFTLIGV